MRRGYNPYLLPKWLRTTRFYLKGCIVPLAVFQGIRTILVPTTGDIIILLLLCALAFLLLQDWI